MPVKWTWTGLDEYLAELAAMPVACTGEAQHILEGKANATAHDIKSAYPWKTGNLARRVVVEVKDKGANDLIAGVKIKNPAQHAHLYELGTQARHYNTATGRHETGAVPKSPGRVFIPRVNKARREVTADLKAMVVRHGAKEVTGDA